ncbi:YhdP family protein [Kaarinaea lacus]
MNFLIKLFRGIWYFIWYLFAATVVLMAAIFGIARLLLPLAGDYNQDIENFATQLAGRPIKIMSLDAEWHGFSPSLVLNNVRLFSSDGSGAILQLSRARLDFDLIGMVLSKQVQFKRFALSGADLSLIREKSGAIKLSGFEIDQPEQASSDEAVSLLHWMLAQGEISVHARNLIYQDMKITARRYHLSNVSFVLKNQGERHLIDGAISFPQHANQEFAFALDIYGDFISGSNWSGKMYISAANLDVTKLFGVLGSRGHSIRAGKSSFQLWSDWRDAELTGLQGDISLEDVRWHADKRFTPLLQTMLGKERSVDDGADVIERDKPSTIRYDHIVGRFMWDRYDEGWQLIGDKFVLARNSRVWPTTQFAVHYFKDKGNSEQPGSRRLDLRANLIRLEDLAPLVPILIGNYQNYAELIEKLAPEGDIQNANFRWSEAERNFKVATRLDNVGYSPLGKIPGVRGLSGDLRFSKETGSLIIKTQNAELSSPDMFRWDIPIKRLNGQIDWSVDSEKIALSSRDIRLVTPHIDSKAILDIDIPRGEGTPFLSLIINFEKGNGSKVSNYLPVSVLKPNTLKWLDAAIIQGDVISGGAIIYGPLNQFPFTKGQGVFETRFEVQNGILDYANEWPELHEINADVLFRGKSLLITADHAKVFDSTLNKVRVSISELGKKPLAIDIEGKVSGKTQEKLNYMMIAPPLNKQYGQYLADLRANGDSELDLNIELKIKPQIETRVSGVLRLQDNELEKSDFPGLLSSINGELAITNDGITATSVKAKLLGQPGRIYVQTISDRNNPNVKDIAVRAVGKFDSKQLANKYFPVLTDMVDGKSGWVVEMALPADRDVKQKRNIQLKVTSNLEGVTLNLPPPFRKSKKDVRQLYVLMNIKNAEKALVKTTFGGQFEGIFEYDKTSPDWITRGEARFGGGPVVLPRSDGLRIAGHLQELSLDIWSNLIKQVSDSMKSAEPEAQVVPAQGKSLLGYSSMINSVNLQVDHFEFLGQQAADMKLSIKKQEEWLDISVDSKAFKGDIRIPNAIEKHYVTLDMQEFHIKSRDDAAGGKIDPRDLPAFKLNGRDVSYDDKQLGRVAIETARTENGLLLQQLVINPHETMIKGFGEWTVSQGQDKSSLEFVLESNNLGVTMKDLGYLETIDKGEGKVVAKLEWPAPLYDPDLSHISGEVALDFKNGRILDIEPGGAARLFGLFSLQTLPKRLVLDFSDLFSKGLGFDSIRGNFKVEDGDAYTNDFQLSGTSADVALKGRIGLGAQDYDQKVRVTPHITDAAVLLSIVTAQPLLILLQQILKQDIEGAAAVEYSLTGSWDNYTLTPVLKPQPVWDDAEDF